MPLKLFAAYVYYDGERAYEKYENRDAGEIVANVTRAESVTRLFAGEGSLNGVPVHVEARASAVHIAVSVVADGMAYPDPKEFYPESDGLWYEPWLVDENGMPMNLEENEVHVDSISADFSGNGHVPERLRLGVAVVGEGEWEGAAMGEPIMLTPVE